MHLEVVLNVTACPQPIINSRGVLDCAVLTVLRPLPLLSSPVCRLQTLELIKERAVLYKDSERRGDSATASPRSPLYLSGSASSKAPRSLWADPLAPRRVSQGAGQGQLGRSDRCVVQALEAARRPCDRVVGL